MRQRYGKWVAKAAVQKTLSVTPGGDRLNRFFADVIPQGSALAPPFLDKHLNWAGQHLEAGRRNGELPANFTALELGPGMFPIIPVAYYLAGARRTYLCDLKDLSDHDLLTRTIDAVLDADDNDTLTSRIGPIFPERVEQLRSVQREMRDLSLSAARARLGFVLATGKARNFVPPHPPHLITSNTVLEHIDPETIVDILAHFTEIAARGAVISHLIDHCDHYAYFDENLSVYNFLRYSDRAWTLIDNDIQPMNRLRAHEYVELFEQAGIPIAETRIVDFTMPDDPVPLAERFRDMTPAQVFAQTSWIISVV